MIQLDLTLEERRVLLETIQSCLSEMHSEIVHTDNWDYKAMLKKRKEILSKILSLLNQPEILEVEG